ncbi:MAG: rRNA maturation RNase YbeY [Thermoguttaceae bacterium]|nr:rRNA maturation RNase YbeY [Thermoguttaceae bacterium]MDW8079332.1 rRNA maturation RNase YbeY [Thermoguttaceae bacterium]
MSAARGSAYRSGQPAGKQRFRQPRSSDAAPQAAGESSPRARLRGKGRKKSRGPQGKQAAIRSASSSSAKVSGQKGSSTGEQLGPLAVDELEVHIADHQSRLKIDRVLVRRAVRQVLTDYGFHRGVLTVALVGDRAIRRLNRLFLGEDEPTDVLSFPLEKAPGVIEGEIIVSTETAQREAQRYDNDPKAELLLYVVHGALHLAGLDDQRLRDRRKMRREEKRYLRLFGYKIRMAPSSTTRP